MSESFNYILEVENQKERLDTNNTNLSFTNVENNIKQNYEINSTIPWADNLALKQYKIFQETNQSKENKETQTYKETQEQLDKEAFKNEMKIFLYEKLGINNNQENNSKFENFIKWVIDWWILDNYDLLVQIYETNWKIILDWLEQLISWEWLKKLAKSLKEDLWTLWDWNAYEKWKISAEVVLWLITAWAWLTAILVKKWVREWIKLTTKQIAKLRVNKERLVQSSEVKWTISDIKNKVDEVIPKQEIDLTKVDNQIQEKHKKKTTDKIENKYNNLTIDKILKLNPKERLKVAEEILNRNLSKEQKDAILEAHNIWNRLENWSYSIWDLKKKVEILQKAWFDNQEVRILLDKWICWKEYPKFKNLYEDPRYSFLEKYKDILGEELSEKDIIWEWNNWIILRHPNKNNKVLKIAKEWENIDKLDIEYKNHREFDEILFQLKSLYKNTHEWLLLQKYFVPKIDKIKNWVFEMEKVNGLSYKSLMHLEYHKDKLWDIINKKDLTDNDLEKILEERWLVKHPLSETIEDEIMSKMTNNEAKNFLTQIYWIENLWHKYFIKDIKPLLNIFEKNGFKHNDEHWGNFMKTLDWKIYIIDFWRSKITKIDK